LEPKTTKLFEKRVAEFLYKTYPFLTKLDSKAMKDLEEDLKKKGKLIEMELQKAESKKAPVRKIRRDTNDTFSPKGDEWYGEGVTDDIP
jgi:hypothetical protein